MLETLVKIGKCLQSTPTGVIKYHPRISDTKKRIVKEVKKNKKEKAKSDTLEYGYVRYFDVNIDTNKCTLTISSPNTEIDKLVKVLRVKGSSSDSSSKYACGSLCIRIVKGDIKPNMINYIRGVEKKPFSLADFGNEKLKQTHNIIRDNIHLFPSVLEDGDLFDIKINGEDFYKHEDIISDFNEWFIDNITDGDGILESSVFSFFKSGDFSQTPNFNNPHLSFNVSKDDFKNIIYSIKIFENLKTISKDYAVLYLPVCDKYDYNALDDYLDKSTSALSTDVFMDKIQGVNDDFVTYYVFLIERGTNTNSILKRYLVFNEDKLKNIHKNIIELKHKYKVDKDGKWSIYSLLEEYFELKTGNPQMTKEQCIRNSMEIQVNGQHNITLDFLIKNRIVKVEKQILESISSGKIENVYSNKFNFFVDMCREKVELEFDNSYSLGRKIGIFCQCRKEYRPNLHKWVLKEIGIFSKKLRKKDDIIKFITTFMSKMTDNSYGYSKSSFVELSDELENITNKIIINKFIHGFQVGFIEFIEKEKKETEQTTENITE